MTQLSNYIAGEWQLPQSPLEQSVCDASTGEPLFQQLASSDAQIEAAVALADKTYQEQSWQTLPAQQRADILERVAQEIEKRGEQIAIADAQSTGVVISLTEKFVLLCAGAFRQAVELVLDPPEPETKAGPFGDLQIERLPLGPAAIIAPWNAPAGIAAHKVASALAAGCPVLLKPSEWAPLSGQLLTEAAQAAGLPAGMWQLLHGGAEVGAALVADPRVRAVSFTGGLRGGQAVAAACAQQIKPAQLELGGNNPLVVLQDADLGAAIDGVVTAITTLNGQWCRALGRLLVHRSLKQALLTGVAERLAKVRLGSSLDQSSEMGPLVSKAHHQLVSRQLEAYTAQGAQLIQTTPVPNAKGWFFAPTLVDGLPSEKTLEEIFGPVATVHSFDSDAQAIELANQTPFGLAAYVFGKEDHALQIANQLRAGLIKINAVTMLNLHPKAPRPAWGLSGLGDEGTVETYEFFRGTRVIGVAARPGAA